MKRMKKFASLLLAVGMVLAMAVSSLAAETDGKITITNPTAGVNYDVYMMFELESFNGNAYSYKIPDAWKPFVDTGYGKDIFTYDDKGYVTLKDGVTIGSDSPEAAELAKEAVAFAKANSIPVVATLSSSEPSKEGLTLGYYVVDSTLGTLCSLTTTAKEVNITEKNEEPTNEKEVEEDSNPNVYGPVDDADIGQVVNFKSTVTLTKGSENVVFHDKMTSGLTPDLTNIKVYTDADMTQELGSGNYAVDSAPSDKDTFDITFTQDYLNTLTEKVTVYVKYSATVNSGAVIGGEGNDNTSHLSYGDDTDTESKTTPPSKTKTYTWSFDIFKFYKNAANEEVRLAGAKFVLLNKDKNKVATIVNGKLTGWSETLPANPENAEENEWPEYTVLTTNDAANLVIEGLDADTYYLREVAAPAGYNKVDDTEVKIEPKTTTTGTAKTMTLDPVTARVENKSGALLPSTGGMGTTIFYVVGSVLLVGAAVLLITKKRMGNTN